MRAAASPPSSQGGSGFRFGLLLYFHRSLHFLQVLLSFPLNEKIGEGLCPLVLSLYSIGAHLVENLGCDVFHNILIKQS